MQSRRGIGTVADGKPILIIFFRQLTHRQGDMHNTKVIGHTASVTMSSHCENSSSRRENELDFHHLKHLFRLCSVGFRRIIALYKAITKGLLD